ncbi:MAG: flippase [Nanoarchaeota archaeon]|nr:flippase [Nanoarchaeota archaeon]
MDNNKPINTLVMGAGMLFIGILFSKAMYYVYRMLVARFLGPESYGQLSLGFAILGISVAFVTGGIPVAVSYYVAYYSGKEDERRIKGTITSALRMSLPISIFVAVLLFTFSDFISIHFFKNIQLGFIFKVFSVILPFACLTTIFQNILNGLRRIKYIIFIKYFSESIILLLSTVAFLILGFGLKGAVYAYVISGVSSFLLFAYVIEKKVFPLVKTKVVSIKNYREIIFYSWPLIFIQAIAGIAVWIDSIGIGYFMNDKSVGIYNSAVPIASLIYIIPTALTALFMPVIINLYAQKKTTQIKTIYKQTIRWTLLANTPFIGIIILFPDYLIKVFFGEIYTPASTALIILALAFFCQYLFLVSHYLLATLKRTKLMLCNTLISTAVNIFLNIILIPRMGINGAAMATAISLLLMGLLLCVEAKLLFGVVHFDKDFYKPILALVLSSVALWWMKFKIGTVSFLSLFFLALLFFLLYFIILMATGFVKKEEFRKLFKLITHHR